MLRGRRFWPRNPDRQRQREHAGGALASAALTAADRCDRCGVPAYVRVLLPSGLELLFCSHHSRQYASALTKIGGRSIIRKDEFAVT